VKTKIDKQFINILSKNPENWKGPFYYNRMDPRLMVPKLSPSLGWTLNFASPYAYITIIALIGVIIMISVFYK
jgi:uncharacterized membrane protein